MHLNRSRARATLTVIFLSVVVPGGLRADLTTTAYYGTALSGHYSDVETLLDVIVKAIEEEDEERFTVESDTSLAPTNDDVYQFITRVADYCDKMSAPRVCRTRLYRLRQATAPHDLFSEYTVNWVGNVMHNWRDLPEFDPADARDFPHVLPRPYAYLTAAKTERYVPRSERTIREETLTYLATKEPERDLGYRTSVVNPPPFESSSLAVALTDFLVSRAGQELVYKLIQDTIDNIPESDDASKWGDPIHLLVPGTASFLKEVDFSQISTLLPALRSVAAEDIQGIPERLAQQATLGSSVRRAYVALESIRHGLVPGLALARWQTEDPEKTCGAFDAMGQVAAEWSNYTMPDDTTTIGGFSVISALRYTTDPEQTNEFLVRLFGDDALACYEERAHQSRPRDSDEGEQEANGTELSLVDVVEGVILRMAQLDRFVGATNSVLGATAGVVEATHDASAGEGTRLPPTVTEVVRSVVDLIEFAQSHFGNGEDSELTLWMTIYRAAIDQRYTDTVSAALRYYYQKRSTIATAKESDARQRTVRAVTRLLTLGASLVEAKTSAEFQAALGASADPVGSYVGKREPGSHLTLGAYMGGMIGGELKLVDIEDSMRTHVGLALPLGVELSFGYSSSEDEERNCCSFGIFVSPIDLGTIASYRIEEWATDGRDIEVEYSEIGWRQLFSPSVYLVLGLFPDVPLSIAAGVQYSPSARRGENDDARVDVLRISMMVAIDVTLLRL